MHRYLVVAHQTLESAELREALRQRLAEEPCSFHLLVPQWHPQGHGLLWSNEDVRADAAAHLEQARLRFLADGIPCTGEVGDANPVYAVSDVLIREGPSAYDGIIVSTLPIGMSRWVHLDVPSRVARTSGLPVTHVVATRVPV